MSFTKLLSGLGGAVGFISGIKGLYDSSEAAKAQKSLLKERKAAEAAWYRRNYYGDFLNGSLSRAAMKRVERTMLGQNRLNRAYSKVNGATPELAAERSRQGLQSMENVVTSLAANDSERRNRVDALHQQNRNALYTQQMQQLNMDEQFGTSASAGGFELLKNALLGVNWGKEK
jgi:non-ribosomal peptide synthetase component E (peptide arylation enzyme)